jgi:uncharacterized protein (TIGR02266 family)
MGRAERAESSESESESGSFERMRSRLQALESPTPPYVDPRALALRALVVTDHLDEPEMRVRVVALGRAGACDPRSVDDLRGVARSLTYALSQRGDAREVEDSPEARALEAEALGLKRAGIRVLDALVSDEGRTWLEVFRLPSEDIDLVFDLRSIALLCEEHRDLLGEAFDSSGAAVAARRVAEALEGLLVGPAAQGEWGRWVARAFTLTLSLYLEACRIGQLLGEPAGTPLAFPSVARIARSARRNRSVGSYSMVSDAPRRGAPTSTAAPAPVLALTLEPKLTLEPTPAPPLTVAPSLRPTPALAPEPALQPTPTPALVLAPETAPKPEPATRPALSKDPEPAPAPSPALTRGPEPAPSPTLAKGPEPAPSPRPTSVPPAAPASAHPPRRFERLSAELEVSLVSTSNFYLGFTENLSEGGLFVATYAARPLGSEIEISVRLPARTDPLVLRGTVRWHREYSATSDGYPGMGIQFDVLSEADKADIAAFLVTRPPLFFVD